MTQLVTNIVSKRATEILQQTPSLPLDKALLNAQNDLLEEAFANISALRVALKGCVDSLEYVQERKYENGNRIVGWGVRDDRIRDANRILKKTEPK